MNGQDDPPPLTLRDFQRAEQDAEYRAFLTGTYGLKDTDLPPFKGGGATKSQGPTGGIDLLREATARGQESEGTSLERLGRGALIVGSAVNPLQDEIAGVVEGVARGIVPGGKGFREGYTGARDASRQVRRAFDAANPKTGLALDVAGALVVPSPFGKATAVTRLGRAAQAAGRGAVQGAAYGFAGAEGGVENQALTTALGGVLGGAAGAVVQPVAEVVGNRLVGRAGRAERRAADIVGQTAKLDDATLTTLPQAAGSRNVAEATDRVGAALSRRVAEQGGVPATRLVESTAARAAEGPDMVFRAAARVLQQNPKDPNALVRTVREAQRAIGPEFEAVLDEPVTLTPALKGLLTKNTHLVRRAFQRGRAITLERVGGTAEKPAFSKPIQDYLRNKVVRDEVPLQTLKVIKEGLDDLARSPDAPRSLTRMESGAAASRVGKIRDAVAEQVKPYGVALEKYAAQAQNVNLLKLGLKGFGATAKFGDRTIRVTPEELGRISASASPEGQGYLAMGLLEAVRRRGGTTLNAEQMNTIRAIAPHGVKALEEALEEVSGRTRLAGEVANAARGAAMRETSNIAQQGMTEVGVGAKRAGAQHLIRSLFQRRDNPEVRDLLAAYLSSTDNAVRLRLLRGAVGNAMSVGAGERAGRIAGGAQP